MTDGHTYTLDCQEDAHCHSCNKSTSWGSVPHTHLPQETADQLPDLYCPPGAPFGPVHFTEYPPNPAYLVLMTPPHTPQPNHPQESVAANESTFTQIFGVMYIILTDLIDFMVPASRPWAILGKFPNTVIGPPYQARGLSARKFPGTPHWLDP
ncbi:hypothetical protein DSO57_1002738 [Entomophthora muscae]|uniref:Uncharacterized protein n=1 Tax=Entomophthora muscae TaxID=34485 RepID=A0ACC2UTJ2_9FUNG|nr:hypothetical protein DSO57_1002738 [Entomophthora muscae]